MEHRTVAAEQWIVPISPTDAAHLLRRSGFGVSPDELDSLVLSADRSDAVDRVLALDQNPADAIPAVSDANFNAGWWSVTTWWLERMRTTPVGIVEKMTLFWHDHFVSSLNKSVSIELAAKQHRVFRDHGMGDFETLTQAVAIDPMMLVYLDNWLNLSWGPQENFARELLELFTVGVGNYDEADVAELARAWTGYSLTADYRNHQYYDWAHDAGQKDLFDLPARNWNGPETITEIVRGVKAEASSRFIAAKVFSLLAYPVSPDDAPVPALAAQFRAANLDVEALVRAVLLSEEFWSERARFALARSPLEWMTAVLKALEIPVVEGIAPNDVFAMGQAPFVHPHVGGWGANGDWVTTGASWTRAEWVSRVRWISIYRHNLFVGLDSATPSEAADEGFRRFGIVDPSAHTRSVVETWAAKCQADGDAGAIPLNLPLLMALSPEFQVS